MKAADRYFSLNYAQARERFLAAARARPARVASFPIDAIGSLGEALATDIAIIEARNAQRLLIVTSATHGVEGFCGSACQLALLDDEELLARAAESGIALLLIHAINPYGFSWLSRTNENNIDLNRNAQSFADPLPDNPDYPDLHPLLVPPEWPPTRENQQAIAAYIEQHGRTRYRDAVSRGQYTHADGIFFGGKGRSQSLRTLDQVLRTHASGFADIGWIDVHTGLGPCGHGEKIFAGRRDSGEVARAQQWWGQDIAVPFAGTSTSADITGHLASTIYTACPDARHTLMALEFGTVPFESMVDTLRGEAWLRAHPDAPAAFARQIRQTIRDAFYCDHDVWKGMVLGQSRVAMLQALCGLVAEPIPPRDLV
ncbi:M14 family metallopeptidase [Paraburkholderia sp. J67]|uniref:M14 family metallopeptidase n=1 Tax=Paraburkholderia sp. J67 TaxID=2805435 RepID=UPI002ABD5127|nr:M14 family metallopeptidase [Paraburkholderia sp. J67]